MDSYIEDIPQPSKYAADVSWFLALTPEERLESCMRLVDMRENAKKI